MPDWNQISRADVLAAITEHDRLGSREFLSRYRFPRSRASTLWHRGQEYDPQAILGLASLQASGPTAGSDLGDEETSIQVLSGMGFDVVVDEEALAAAKAKASTRKVAAPRSSTRSTTPRSASTAKAPAAKPRRTTAPAEPKICPTCFMALPATGICDNCD